MQSLEIKRTTETGRDLGKGNFQKKSRKRRELSEHQLNILQTSAASLCGLWRQKQNVKGWGEERARQHSHHTGLMLQFHLTITEKYLEAFRWGWCNPVCVPTIQKLDAKWREIERARLDTGSPGLWGNPCNDILQPNELTNLPRIYHQWTKSIAKHWVPHALKTVHNWG